MQLSISSDLEHLIVQQATSLGFPSAETYLRAVLRAPAEIVKPDSISSEEFERLMDELANEDVPTLPADFSRADVYGEHP